MYSRYICIKLALLLKRGRFLMKNKSKLMTEKWLMKKDRK